MPVEVKKKVAGSEVAREKILQDETINPGLTVQKAALYPTIFKEGGSVTPANACGISDGASAMLIMTADKAQELGYTPLARIVAYGYAGVEPQRMGIAPAYCRAQGAGARQPEAGGYGPGGNQRGLRGAGAGGGQGAARTMAGIGSASTSTAARLRWATRWVRRAAASW